jgi:Domain of unknown function (DUF1707)
MSEWLPAQRRQVRIGDAERDQAVSALGEHFVAGRLTQDEFDERSDTATKARYAEDLLPLFDDLPGPVEPVQPQVRRPGPPPFVFLAPVVFGLFALAVVLTAPWVLWLLFGLLLFRGPWRHHHHRRQHWNGHYQYHR